MDKTILLLGLGMQGKAALHDLVAHSSDCRIIAADIRDDTETYLRRYPSERVSCRHLDVTDEAGLASLVREADIIVEALPARFALPVGRLAAECAVSLVSSMYYLDPGEQDPSALQAVRAQIAHIHEKAKTNGATILTEFGLDPGIDLMLGARAISELDTVRELHSYGAGIPTPEAALNPLRYKFSWSVIGVLRAYRRPARVIRGGRVVTVGARELFEEGNYHILELDEIGVPLECFPNGDSVHYAHLFGIHDTVKEMGRYTCRLPGHCAFWRTFVQSGFLEEEPVEIGDTSISPVAWTASVLGSQRQFQYAEDEQDMTLIRVDARGERNGRNVRVVYQMIDRRDLQTGFTSMQKTVGFMLGLGARLILEGKLTKRGLVTPLDLPYDLVIPELGKHHLHVTRRVLPWE
jgi:lysine 6-dehydrogenase